MNELKGAMNYRPSNHHEGWRGDQHPARADDEEVAKKREEAGQTSHEGELQHPTNGEGTSAVAKS
jgi:hypothetical protein